MAKLEGSGQWKAEGSGQWAIGNGKRRKAVGSREMADGPPTLKLRRAKQTADGKHENRKPNAGFSLKHQASSFMLMLQAPSFKLQAKYSSTPEADTRYELIRQRRTRAVVSLWRFPSVLAYH